MPLKTIFMATLMFAFAMFTAQFLNMRPDDPTATVSRFRVSLFLGLQVGWLATSLLTFVTLRDTWKTPPGMVRQFLWAMTWLSFFAQFILLCNTADSLDQL